MVGARAVLASAHRSCDHFSLVGRLCCSDGFSKQYKIVANELWKSLIAVEIYGSMEIKHCRSAGARRHRQPQISTIPINHQRPTRRRKSTVAIDTCLFKSLISSARIRFVEYEQLLIQSK